MSFSMPQISKQTAMILIAILAVFAAIGTGNYLSHRKAAVTIATKAEAPLEAGQVTLQGRGTLPSLHAVLSGDATLQGMIAALRAVPVADIFIRPTEINMMVVDTLFRWAKADQAEPRAYGPYVDARVASFLKTIGELPATAVPGQDIDIDTAAILNERWFVISEHYRTRLLAQLSGGKVYEEGAVSYDLPQDQIIVSGALSKDFIAAFQTYLQRSDNSAEAMRGLLDFVNATKGFSNLSDAEQDLIMSLQVTGPAPQQAAQPLPATTEPLPAP